jgi:hypothetical protein
MIPLAEYWRGLNDVGRDERFGFFFTLMIQGRRFGVHEEDATMLANSFDEVCRRIAGRGRHGAPFGIDGSPYEIATATVTVRYGDPLGKANLFGMTHDELAELVYEHRLVWAPDGDAAFDDGSHVLHLDVGDRVRLVAFKRGDERLFDPATLVDQWLPIDEFYSVLEGWRESLMSHRRKRSQWPASRALPIWQDLVDQAHHPINSLGCVARGR